MPTRSRRISWLPTVIAVAALALGVGILSAQPHQVYVVAAGFILLAVALVLSVLLAVTRGR
jgi:hypothetical protein